MRIAQGFVIAAAWALLVACGGGSGGGSATATAAAGALSPYPAAAASCGVADQRAWLRDYMNDQYFWYDRQGAANEAATSMPLFFASLLAPGLDRFSGAQSTADFLLLNQAGKRFGYGYQLAWSDAAQTSLRFRVVEPLSPLGQAGVSRGEAVIRIDGFSAGQIAAGALSAVSTAGVPREFVVANGLGVQRTLVVQSSEYALSPVLHSSVLTASNGAKVGYLVYQEFNATGAAALGAAINGFRAAGISELILDLRYNGGGSTTQARNVASLVGGAALNGRVFANYRFNDKNASSNVVQTFTSSLGALPAAPLAGLRRVVVITSADTASASEMVINGLRPYMPVVLIGSATYGKPYGSQPRDSCGTTYSAINLEISNALGAADFANGFAPTCAIGDDLSRQWGDPAEQRTAAALTYIATDLCPAVATVPGAATYNTARAAMANRAGGASGLGMGEIAPPRAWLD